AKYKNVIAPVEIKVSIQEKHVQVELNDISEKTISAKTKAPKVIPSVCCLASPPNLLATNPIEPQANIGTSARRTPCMFIFISLK
ncbi:hypothetical protein Q6281_25990, partial [Klebsiella pneumoniae]|nr:hypothetical protein [Klebsiella pneumoniae]